GWTVFEALGVEKSLKGSGTCSRRFRRGSMKGRVFLLARCGKLSPRVRRHENIGFSHLGGTFTVLLGLRDPSPNYTRQIQIRFGATSWGNIETQNPSFRVRSSFGQTT